MAIPRDRTATGGKALKRTAGVEGPPARTGKVNPWLPTGDIKAPQFVRGHPGWDGRGVRLAVLDTGVDWTAPGLARTSAGGPKVTRWQDATGEGLVHTAAEVRVRSPAAVASG